MNLDDVLPDPAYRIDASRVIHAPAPIVWHELLTVSLSSLPLTWALAGLRHLPAVLARRERPLRASDTFLDETPIPVVYEDEPHQLISAGLSQPWRVFGAAAAPALDLDGFRDWDQPGWIKVAMSFDLLADPAAGRTILATQTRIGLHDPATARAFRPYWGVIRGASALIRREVVRRVQLRAERSALDL